jgi:hypothetical protein
MASMDSGAEATALVVEDEELARLIITDYLREGGFALGSLPARQGERKR